MVWDEGCVVGSVVGAQRCEELVTGVCTRRSSLRPNFA